MSFVSQPISSKKARFKTSISRIDAALSMTESGYSIINLVCFVWSWSFGVVISYPQEYEV